MSDDFDLDDDFDDFDDFGDISGSITPKDDRKPISKVASHAIKEFTSREGQLESLKTIARAALPKGYSEAFEAIVEVKDEVTDIYDKTLRDLEPSIKAAKRIGAKTIPAAEKILPKYLIDKLKAATKTTEATSRVKFDPNEAAITASLQGIFGAEQQASNLRETRQELNEKANRNIRKKEFISNLNSQNKIAGGIARLVGYQDTILNKYHRKSLELQHRQFFTTRDLLAFTKANSAETLTALESIVKNSALPNEVKLRDSELLRNANRLKLVGAAQESVQRRLGSLPKRLKKGLIRQSKEFTSGLRESLESAEDLGELVGDEDGFGPSKEELIGGKIGSSLRTSIGGKLGRSLRDVLGKKSKVSAFGERLLFETENISRTLDTKISEAEGGIFGILKDLVGTAEGVSETVVHNLKRNATDPIPWDVMSRRTLIEIIPGFLSRQLQQLTNIATGSVNDRIVFDAGREEFTTRAEAVSSLRSNIEKQTGVNLQQDTLRLVESIDTAGVLSSKAKTDFGLQLTQEAAKGRVFDPIKYSDPLKIKSNDAELIASVVSSHFNIKNGKIENTDLIAQQRKLKASKSFNRLGTSVGSINDIIGDFSATGDKEILRDLGLITKFGDSSSDTVSDKFKEDVLVDLISGKRTNTQFKSKSPKGFERLGTSASSTNNGISNQDNITIEDIVKEHAETNSILLSEILKTIKELEFSAASSIVESGKTPKGNLFSPAFRKLKGLSGLGFSNFKLNPLNLLKGKLDSGLKDGIISSAKDKLSLGKDKLNDLYVKGKESSPVLIASEMLAGNYRDKITGKVIRNYEDIKGEVIDGNGNIVLSRRDYASGFSIKKSRGKGILKFIGRSASLLGRIYALEFKAIGGILGFGLKAVKGVFRLAKLPKDIYTSGSRTPKLFSTGFKDGSYFSKLTGRVIKNIDDIKGEVVDKFGNIVLSRSDLDEGLIDVNGKTISFKGLVSKGLGLADRATKGIIKGISFINRKALGLASGAKSFISGLFKGDGKGSFTNDVGGTNMLLLKIYNHLATAFPISKRLDDDLSNARGGRLGGFREILRKRKEAKEAEEQTELGSITGKKGGILSGLGGGLKALLGKKKKPKKDDDGILNTILAGGAALGSAFTAFGGGAAAAGTSAAVGGGAAAAGTGTTLALISNPVGWALLAGAAAYGGFKAFKALSRRADLEPLEKLRFLQYGIPINNLDAVIAIRYLEDNIMDDLEIDNKGIPKLDINFDEIWNKYANDFGANVDNPIHKTAFGSWFYDRFIPVLVTHMSAAKHLNDVDVTDVDDELDNKLKLHFVNRVQFGSREAAVGMTPYAVKDSPWPDIALVNNLKFIVSLSNIIRDAAERNEEADLNNDVKITPLQSVPTSISTKDPKISEVDRIRAQRNNKKSNLARDIASKEGKKYMDQARNAAKANAALISKARSKPKGDRVELIVPSAGRISSPFGTRTHPIRGRRGMHKGIDIAAPMGSPIYASANGIFERVGVSKSYGNVIYIRHDDGRLTRYAHMSAFGPGIQPGKSVGMPVIAGELIGYVGSTGKSTGPHLHFEYRDSDGVANAASVLNPVEYFSKADADIADKTIDAAITTAKNDTINEPIVPSLGKNSRTKVNLDKVNKTVDKAKMAKDAAAVSNLADGSNKAPIINVEGTDLTDVNKNTIDIGNIASAQRNEQVNAINETNNKLDSLILVLSNNSKTLDSEAKTKIDRSLVLKDQQSKPIRSVVDLTKTG